MKYIGGLTAGTNKRLKRITGSGAAPSFASKTAMPKEAVIGACFEFPRLMMQALAFWGPVGDSGFYPSHCPSRANYAIGRAMTERLM